MVVYAGAMYCFAAELAFAPRRVRRPADEGATAVTERSLATVGGTASSYDVAGAADGVAPTGTTVGPTETDKPDRSARLGRIAVALTVLAFALHLGAVVARGLSAGRPPWGNMFEFSTTGALAVTGIFLVLLAKRDARYPVRYVGVFVILPVLLTLGLAVAVLYTESEQLVPALKSVWLVIHVSAAIIASGIFTVAFTQTVLYLVQDRMERRGGGPAFMTRFPTAAALDRAAYRMHAFAFPIWTFAVIAGAIWAENAWGRYWGWDPKETWAFITWVVYACYLHARATAGWRGRKAAYIALLGYGTFLFNYLVVNIFLAGLHSYAGVG
ncbi:MAG: c-type cytochrome biogenesis protein CcsB [Actinomycetes bacterium]